MLGVVVAIIYAAIVYLFGAPNTPAETFVSAINFLFWWYIITSIILMIIYLLIALIITGTLTCAGGKRGGVWGGILGFLGGGVLSGLIIILGIIARGLLIVGTYLLKNSLVLNPDGSGQWIITKLIIGGLLLVIGLIMNKNSSSSSKK